MINLLQTQSSVIVDPLIAATVTREATRTWEQVNFCLSEEFLSQEVFPSVIRVELPEGKKVSNRGLVLGYVDRRMMPEGRGWQVSTDGAAFEVYLPSDPDLRSRYLADGGVEYSFIWPV